MLLSEAIFVKQHGESLATEDAFLLFDNLLGGEWPESQIAALLTAFPVHSLTSDELTGFAKAMRKHMIVVAPNFNPVLDTCGTGGGVSTLNLSTGSAILLAAMGCPVAKHGNRAVTSRCGSADILEALGVPLGINAESVVEDLDKHKFSFLFAPAFHPKLKAIGKVRRELPFRTVFNLLGPLCNPAHATMQIIGVFDGGLIRLVAETLVQLGTQSAAAVHSEDGMDEISPCAPTNGILIQNGELIETSWLPSDFGLPEIKLDDLAPADDLKANAEALRGVLSGKHRVSEAILPTAGLLYSFYKGCSLDEAVHFARQTLKSGAALQKLDELKGAE